MFWVGVFFPETETEVKDGTKKSFYRTPFFAPSLKKENPRAWPGIACLDLGPGSLDCF